MKLLKVDFPTDPYFESFEREIREKEHAEIEQKWSDLTYYDGQHHHHVIDRPTKDHEDEDEDSVSVLEKVALFTGFCFYVAVVILLIAVAQEYFS